MKLQLRSLTQATRIASLAALLPGCGLTHSAFEGTWLLAFDLDYDVQGDCVSEDAPTYAGEASQLVDIYDASNGELVVLLEDVLTGEAQGRSFEVGYEQSWTSSDGEDTDTDAIVMDGELSAGVLSGQLVSTQQSVSGSDTWVCQQTYDYTAQKVKSNRNQYLEN